jgi:hypothetical protein
MFQKNDVVVCVNSGTGRYLTLGKEYTVVSYGDPAGFVYVRTDRGDVASFYEHRFKLKAAAAPVSTGGAEADPNGVSAHSPGAKLDSGKNRMALVLGSFARALIGVSEVGTFGANKYTDNGWLEVPNGFQRYEDAQLRHQFYRHRGETHDSDSKLLHLKHEAWNALAKLELYLIEEEKAVA